MLDVFSRLRRCCVIDNETDSPMPLLSRFRLHIHVAVALALVAVVLTAADDVEAYFTLLEQARHNYVEEHGPETSTFAVTKLHTDELLAKADDHLHRAAEKAESGPEIYRRRVAFVAAGLQHSRLLVEIIEMMAGYWSKPDAKVASQVKQNWQAIEQLCQSHPYAINWGPIRPSTSRMLGLYSDHPNPKWKGNAPQDLDQN
jgi:hypothetical protein